MTQRLMSNTSSDVYESVRAVLVDKEDPMDNAPAWRPPALCDATPDMVESHLALLPHGDELLMEALKQKNLNHKQKCNPSFQQVSFSVVLRRKQEMQRS